MTMNIHDQEEIGVAWSAKEPGIKGPTITSTGYEDSFQEGGY